MIKRLRIKFVCVNMLIVTLMLGVIFAMVLHFTGSSMEMESIRMMQASVGPHPGPRGFFLTVRLDQTEGIAHISGEDYDLTREQIDAAVSLALEEEQQAGVLKEFDLRYCRIPSPGGQQIVFGDISMERSMMASLVRNCLLIGGAAFCVFFLISLLLARWAVKPVEQAWNQQRQFVADASHELKTPLTVILTNAELLRSEEYAPEQKDGFVRSILTMSQQMRGLVEMLLDLARVDAGQLRTEKSLVDLSQVVVDSLLPFEALFFENQMELAGDVAEKLFVWGSESHLCQVAEILLDNALKYSMPGKTTVSLRKQGHWAVLSVSNPGAPMSEEVLNNLFKRFYRADTARSMNRSYGLGLSIAQGIVMEHGGKISAESENGMNTFTVSIPMLK